MRSSERMRTRRSPLRCFDMSRDRTLSRNSWLRAWTARPQHAERVSASGRVVVHTLLGWYAPRGTQREVIDAGVLVGGQLAYRLRRIAYVTGFTVTQSDDNRSRAANDPAGLLLLQFDAGLEAGGVSSFNPALRGFVAAGFGARSYRFEATPRPTVAAAYAGVGAERHFRRSGLRVEARDYVSAASRGAARGLRHDVQLLAGLGYHFR